MKIRNSIFFILVALLVISCDEKRVFDEYKTVGNSWHKDSIVTFDLPQLDATKSYNLFVNVRDNNDYPFNNLFLIVAMQQPNRIVISDTLEYQMTEADGTLLGDGFTDIKESKLYYKENVKFDLKGKYKVTIQHANRQTGNITGVKQLAGITDIGFRIESKE